ncbi:unnamed protein product, partial [Closterium sp. NIES-64]
SCEAVVRNVAAMESDFALLHKTISTTATTTPAADAKRKRKEALYALGSRVKYLVDTPEKIWGCLDERMFLEAAQRFMRAWEVHQLLSPSLGSKGAAAGGGAGGGGGGDGAAAGVWQAQQQGLMASFPLLRHQWPLVETFRTQIVERSRECLHDASRIPAAGVGEYAAALAAVAVMEELSSHDLLSLFLNAQLEKRLAGHAVLVAAVAVMKGLSFHDLLTLFLDARGACLCSQLASATLALGAGGSFADALAALLSQLVALIQTGQLFLEVSSAERAVLLWLTLCQTGQLFLEVSSAERAVLLGVLLQGAPQAQLFGGIPRPDGELALWHTHRDALEARLPSLSSKEVADACQDWLKACAADIAGEYGRCTLVSGKSMHQPAPTGRELALWHTHRNALEARLPSLSSKEVAEACQDWLKVCAADIAGILSFEASGSPPAFFETCQGWLKVCAADIAAESKSLLSRVTQIRHLAQAEAATRAAITNKDIFAASLDWLTSAFGCPPESPWRALCELLLKEPKDLWSELFEAAFALRAREIIDGAFAGLTLREEIDGVLREVGDVVAVAAVVSAQNAAAAAAAGTGAGAAGVGAAGGGAAVVTAAARAIASEKAAGLAGGNRRFGAGWATLPPLTDVIGQAGFEETGGFAVGEAVWGSPGEELGAVGLGKASSASRTKELAPYLQDRCHECVMRLVRLLASRLGDLQKQQQQAEEAEQAEKTEKGERRGARENGSVENSSESAAATAAGERTGNGSGGVLDAGSRSNGPDAAIAAGRLSAQVAVEQALLIGRLAAAVAQSSSSLAVALGPSSTWPAVAAAAAATAGGYTAASAESTASRVASEASTGAVYNGDAERDGSRAGEPVLQWPSQEVVGSIIAAAVAGGGSGSSGSGGGGGGGLSWMGGGGVGMLSPDASNPKVLSLGALPGCSPKMLLTPWCSPKVLSQDASNPKVLSQGALPGCSPKMLLTPRCSPKMLLTPRCSPKVLSQDASNPKVLSQDASNPKVLSQGALPRCF